MENSQERKMLRIEKLGQEVAEERVTRCGER
jgi:hypothetical protein